MSRRNYEYELLALKRILIQVQKGERALMLFGSYQSQMGWQDRYHQILMKCKATWHQTNSRYRFSNGGEIVLQSLDPPDFKRIAGMNFVDYEMDDLLFERDLPIEIVNYLDLIRSRNVRQQSPSGKLQPSRRQLPSKI